MSALDLISLAALEVACDEGVTPHLGRLEAAIDSTTGPQRFVLERVLEALRIHLPLLQRRPDALWPALYAHCAFVDSPRARRFGVSTPGPDMPLSDQIGRWLDERRALHADAPWLKALTPTTAWGGSLTAELRPPKGTELVRFDGHHALLASNEGFTRWHLASGQTRAAEPSRPAGPAGLVSTPKQGGLVLQRGGHSQWLLEPNWSVSAQVVSESGTVVACVAWEDEGFTAFAFDLTSGAQLAGEDAGAIRVALSPNGRFLAFRAFDGTTIIRDLQGGPRLGLASDEPSSFAVSDDGRHLAQVEAGVVRCYRPHPGPWPSCFPQDALQTTFTRDGSKLLLGQYVFDGADGSVLSRHDFVTPQFLEGGPAPFSTRLTPERLCVNQAFRVVVLELGTGQQHGVDELGAASRATAAWSGDGRVYATARRGHDTVLRFDGRLVQRLTASGPVEALALDETGSLLACLLTDGTLELQPRGPKLRQIPGGRTLAFLAHDTALAISGSGFTVALGLDGTERWRSPVAFDPSDAGAAQVEVLAGLRPPSVVEALELVTDAGLLRAGETAVFPSSQTREPWLRSPRGTLLARGTTLLAYEQR